jgi:hypothetical protein
MNQSHDVERMIILFIITFCSFKDSGRMLMPKAILHSAYDDIVMALLDV